MGVLKVRLVKASNLEDADYIGKTDPYVRLELEQDTNLGDIDYGYKNSSTKSNDCNPVWNQDFEFTIPTLDKMVLRLIVYDADIATPDDKCGECKIKLEDKGITSSPKRIENAISRKRPDSTIVVDVSYSM